MLLDQAPPDYGGGVVDFVNAQAVVFVSLAACAAAMLAAMWLLRESLAAEKHVAALQIQCEALSDQLFAATETLESQRQLIETQSDLVVRRDLSGAITMVNPAYAAAAGEDPDALLGTRFTLGEGEARLMGEGRWAAQGEDTLRGGDDERCISWSVIPVRDRDGRIVERFAVGRDVSERRRAEAASEAKSRFLATVSHEVRTPLNGVLGMADLLLDTAMTAEQTTYVRAVKTSGEALLTLIDEILDFSRIEAGKAEIAEDAFDLRQVVEGVVELLAPRAQGKGLEIALSIDPTTPLSVLGDGARLRQILLNLAGNAVKFTEVGGVGISVGHEPEGLLIEIADTGPGIPADRLEAIFAEFEQVDGAADGHHGGAGLGLAISRRLAERMGGTIMVESRLNEGSSFRLRLPLRVALGGAADPREPCEMAARKLLIVSSGPYEGRFMSMRLAEQGAAVTLVRSVHAGLAALTEQKFDAAMIDCGLGDEEARQLAAVARQAGVARRLVLLSPYERRQFGSPTDAGFDGYLVKPVRPRSLFSRLSTSGALPFVAEPVRTVASSAAAQALPVLLAEDNDINALLATRLLERLGATVTRVRDGEAALATLLLTIAGRATPFRAALLDMRMPGRDGRSVASTFRQAEAAAGAGRLPMAAVTANAFPQDREQALAAGFDAFLPKPIDRLALERFVAAARAQGGNAAAA
jgi:signal transduction histidine kinase/CheY-like chemotaxis protein